MLKKLLCVMISALMVISVLPMGVMAVTTDGIVEVGDTVDVDGTSYTVVAVDTDGTNGTYGGNDWGCGSWLEEDSSALQGYLNTTGALIYVQYTSTANRGWVQVGIQNSSGTMLGSSSTGLFAQADTLKGITFSVSEILSNDSTYDMTTCYQVYTNLNGGSASSPTATTVYAVSILVPKTSTPASTSLTTVNYTFNDVTGTKDSWSSSTYSADSNGVATMSLANWGEYSFTLPSGVDASTLSAITFNVASGDISHLAIKIYGDGEQVDIAYETSTIAVTADLSSYSTITFALMNNNYGSSLTYVIDSFSITAVQAGVEHETTSTASGIIYVNEDYHAFIINGHFLCVPHTVDSNGYCTVCKEYIGTGDEEVATTSINGVDYVEAYTVDVSLGSSDGWGQLDLGDTALIDALSQEGALLVITRDGVSDTVHNGSETYEKFGLVNSWWSGEWIALGTAGHTSATEEGIIDCISDDGTTVIYDGATVYAEWVARGMTAGGTVELISNTSNSLKITNVTVYVPVGTVVTETVDVEEPAEDTNSETEDDELDVDDTDAEEVTETNPTTGAVLALVPMAIAGFAVVASKRR